MTVTRRNLDGSLTQVNCPQAVAVAVYNRYMGRVDFSDQMKRYYAYDRKSRCWWLRLFYHLIDICVVNAYILYCKFNGLKWHPPLQYKPVKKLEFRMQLVDSLVNHFTNRKLVGPTVTPVVSLVPSGHKVVDLCPLGIHAGRCEFCSIGHHKAAGKRKETQFVSPRCMKRLCLVGCWTKFHAKYLPTN